MTEFQLGHDQKLFTPTNLNIGTWPKIKNQKFTIYIFFYSLVSAIRKVMTQLQIISNKPGAVELIFQTYFTPPLWQILDFGRSDRYCHHRSYNYIKIKRKMLVQGIRGGAFSIRRKKPIKRKISVFFPNSSPPHANYLGICRQLSFYFGEFQPWSSNENTKYYFVHNCENKKKIPGLYTSQ